MGFDVFRVMPLNPEPLTLNPSLKGNLGRGVGQSRKPHGGLLRVVRGLGFGV